MSRKISDQEVEQLQAQSFVAPATTRGRLLSVLELLLRFTDENEGITAREAARVLSACGTAKPAENTLRDDLCALAELSPFGIKIIAPAKGDNRGYRVAERIVTSDEAVLLLDMVRTCKFITQDQQQDFERKLDWLIPEKKQDEVIDTIVSSEHENAANTNILSWLNTASRAIKENRQLSFSYTMHWMDGTYVETPLRTEDPVAILFSFGHYYLETIDPSKTSEKPFIQLRRLDHICRMAIPGPKVKEKKLVEQLRREAPSLLNEMIDMRGDGVTRTLFLRVDGSYAGLVYDRFGHGLKFEHISENEDSATGFVKIKVQLSETFFRWIFGMAGGVVIYEPTSIRWLQPFEGGKTVSVDRFNQLVGDYDIAIGQYRDLLKNALALSE